ncbi:MAG: serine hydrolase [Acidimicrobiia bacterium]
MSALRNVRAPQLPWPLAVSSVLLVAALMAACSGAKSAFGEECDSFQPNLDDPFHAVNRTLTDPSPLDWPTADPGTVGLDSAVLEQAAEEVALSPMTASLLVVRNGKLVFERYFNGFDATDANNVHSLSKSILSVVTGIAIDEGHLTLDAQVGDVLPPNLVVNHGELTVRDLLTMAGGLEVPEPDTNYEWQPSTVPGEPSLVRAVLASPRVVAPGTEFAYNTGLTQVLAAMLTEATGMSLCQYAADRLLGPLGIDVEGWHVEPGGYLSGGFDMFMTPREIARFGQLVLDEGALGGDQIVSSSWLDQSLSPRWDLGCVQYPPIPMRYGYLWWGYDIGGHEVWIASGYGGQDMMIVDDLDLVAVITHDTTEIGGARVPMRALFYELLLQAVHGQAPPTEPTECQSSVFTLATVAADGSTPPSPVPGWPANTAGPFSPGAERLAYTELYLDYWDLYTISRNGTDIRRVTRDAVPDAMPSWSPDGTMLAFVRGEPGQSDLYLINADGSALTQLTDLDGYAHAPAWSTDGTRIAFIWGHGDIRGWGHPGELWVIDRDGSNLRQLREAPTTNPIWSPDGRQIVFDSITAAGRIGLLDLDTGTVSDLGLGFFPRWSPDGTRIAFAALDEAGGSDIFSMAANGTDRVQLTDDPNFDGLPSWTPDGTTILYWTTLAPSEV